MNRVRIMLIVFFVIVCAATAVDVLHCALTARDFASEPTRPYRYFLFVPLALAAGAVSAVAPRPGRLHAWLTVVFFLLATIALYHTAVLVWYLCHRIVPF
jgi:hypothetical protein